MIIKNNLVEVLKTDVSVGTKTVNMLSIKKSPTLLLGILLW
jgi:hypothetical protein